MTTDNELLAIKDCKMEKEIKNCIQEDCIEEP